MIRSSRTTLLILLCASVGSIAQPRKTADGVEFVFPASRGAKVSVLGDFNGWSKDADVMARTSGGWRRVRAVIPGTYQYKFLLDDSLYVLDPNNPAVVDNFNRSGKNSVFVVTREGEVLLTDMPPSNTLNMSDSYPDDQGYKNVYLNIIWHQHQPLYVDPAKDQLQAPWVRTHATKDYYDMASTIRAYPEIHCTMNLTSSLLHQLTEYYVRRLHPFVNAKKNRVDAAAFLKKWKGKTDPWIDIALSATRNLSPEQKNLLYKNPWNAFGISEIMIQRFPGYQALQRKLTATSGGNKEPFTEQELRELKFWFYLAYFDPDFLASEVTLADGSVVRVHELVEKKDGAYHLRRQVTEDDCNRIVAEMSKVMANVVPLHKQMSYNAQKRSGQLEIITTPFYHPILPLIYDSDIARVCQPGDSLPRRFSFPQDADVQVAKAVRMYRNVFGASPMGMWPGEGSVSQDVLGVLRKNGIIWTASDVKVLERSKPAGRPNTRPFRFPAGTGSMSMVFRDTDLSDRIGFMYQPMRGEEAAEDFVQSVLSYGRRESSDDILVTVILDGENAWEWYRQDEDGKEFLNALYRKLSKLYNARRIVTVTMAEYIHGNPSRGVAAHPVEEQMAMEWLHPGSWINGNYDTWVGEPEENNAWEYLLQAREDLERSGLRPPDPSADPPAQGTKEWNSYRAWESMYAAEGSDWFWWYGYDQQAPSGDKPFDDAFRVHLQNVYRFGALAGANMPSQSFTSLLTAGNAATGGQGTMARSTPMQSVLFVCDVGMAGVDGPLFIAGNVNVLGSWNPNEVRMYDDGTHGDIKAGDGQWSLLVEISVGTEIRYKFTNNGRIGSWSPGDESPGRNRTAQLPGERKDTVVIRNVFGVFE